MKLSFRYLILLFFTILASCNWESPYPKQLTDADNFFTQGNYDAADSLLEDFDKNIGSYNVQITMYRQLLAIERTFVRFGLTESDFSMADSLARFYYNNNQRKSAMAQLFLAETYRSSYDYPSALNCLLKAEKEIDTSGDLLLQIWKNRIRGDIYFEQRMLTESTKHYRDYYALACKKKDTLRIAQSSFSMARVWIIENSVDSVIFYLNQAIRLGENTCLPNTIVTPAKSTLADIYIQIEQYDKASEFLTRDSIDDENWAYWHLGQQHTDSAVYYFNKMLGNYSWLADVTFLQTLAEIEEQRGNRGKALEYYKKLNAAKDSLKAHSQIEETRQTEARHKFDMIKQERDEADRQKRNLTYLIVGIVIIVVVVALATIMAWRAYRTKEADKLLRKKLLQHTEERKTQLSTEQKAANEHQIDLLERSPLRERIKENAGKDGFRLTDGEWHELAAQIDLAYDQFTARLRILYDGITEYELHVCYLIKLGITSTDIGNMLYKSKSAVGMTRQRLYKKLTGSKGTARDLNELIRQF